MLPKMLNVSFVMSFEFIRLPYAIATAGKSGWLTR